MITTEQEALLRAFENVKKMQYGELTLYLQAGNIVRYEVKKSKSLIENKKPNAEVIREMTADIEGEEVIAI